MLRETLPFSSTMECCLNPMIKYIWNGAGRSERPINWDNVRIDDVRFVFGVRNYPLTGGIPLTLMLEKPILSAIRKTTIEYLE